MNMKNTSKTNGTSLCISKQVISKFGQNRFVGHNISWTDYITTTGLTR